MNDPAKRLDELEEFLSDTSDESKEDVMKELRTSGVNTKQFFKRVQETVETSYSEQLRAIAAREQQHQDRPSFLEDLAGMTRESMLSFFEKLRSGAYGSQYQEAAVARCRNKDATELSGEELRSWLEDIGDTLGEPEE